MMRSFLILVASTAAVMAQQPGAQQGRPQPPMVITQADADEFREIVQMLTPILPPIYLARLIKWYTTILREEQLKEAAEAKAKEKP